MKRKFDFKKILKSIKKFITKYASTNILFLSYVIISLLLGFAIRLFTIGAPIYFRATIADLMFVLFVGAFGYLIRPRYQFRYFLIWVLFYTFLCIGNTIYYQFYQSFLSVNLISTASMLGEVNDSVFDKLNVYQFLYLIFPCIFIFIHTRLSKKNYYFEIEKTNKDRKNFIYTLGASVIFIVIIACGLTGTDTSRLIKQWNREYLVRQFGIYSYTVNDLVQSVQPKINTLFGYDEAALNFREFYACKFEKETKVNKYTNKFKGRNVIFIHAESMQNFLVNLKINGEEVTAYKLKGVKGYYLVYATNTLTGYEGYYLYDTEENSVQRYNTALLDKVTSEKDKYFSIVLVMSCVCFLTMLFLLIEVNRDSKRKN